MARRTQKSESVTVHAAEVGQRLDKFLLGKYPHLTRSCLQNYIKKGFVLINGHTTRPKHAVNLGDAVCLNVPKPAMGTVAEPPDLDILYEDAAMLVINKPAGIVVHPGAGETGPTIWDALVQHATLSCGIDDLWSGQKPGIVHRLDKDTSGVMVCAKSHESHRRLAGQFRDKRTASRQYLALLRGQLPAPTQVVQGYLFRDPTRRTAFSCLDATEYQMACQIRRNLSGYRYSESVLTRVKGFADLVDLVEVQLCTGRTHQIRVHAKKIGCPVVGDQTYGTRNFFPKTLPDSARVALEAAPRQMLHAWRLSIQHPIGGRPMQFTASLPADFQGLLNQLQACLPNSADITHSQSGKNKVFYSG